MSSGVWEDLRKPVDQVTTRASQNAKHLGQDWNIQYLEDEGAKNEKNPGRAYGKAAQAVAAWYLGGLLGGSGGAAGSSAGGAAASGAGEAAGAVAETAAQEMARKAAEEALKQELLNSAQYASQQGLLSGAGETASQGFGNTMEAGLLDTGYTPSNLGYAFKNSSMLKGGSPSLGQNLQNFGSQRMTEAQNGAMLNRAMAPGSGARDYAFRQGVNMMQPEEQPRQQSQPFRYEPQEQQPIYGQSGQGGPYGGLMGGEIYGQMSEEEKRRLRAMGYQV